MISNLLLEAAVRSALLGLAVWIGLRIFVVRNVLAQKAAWGLVLVSALIMPLVLPLAGHLPGVAIPSAAIRSIASMLPKASPTPRARMETPASLPLVTASIRFDEKPAARQRLTIPSKSHEKADRVTMSALDRGPAFAISDNATTAVTPAPDHASAAPRLSLLQIAGLLYVAIAAILLVRLFYGLLVAIHVWQSAKPVRLQQSALLRGLRLRSSDSISSPVTIGSGVVLPAGYHEWDAEKLRIVLAHERSHVRQGDFYLQLLAGAYAAVVWLSPLGWWLKRKLSDLAEAISDRAGLEEAGDRTSYAQVLLEFAATPRPTVIGVAMARSGSLSRRIERLLNDASFRQAFAGTRRSFATVLVIPLALFAASALVRVDAAGQAPTAPPAPAVVPVTPATPATPVEPFPGASSVEPVSSAPEIAPVPGTPGLPPQAGTPQVAPMPETPPSDPAAVTAPPPPASPALTLTPVMPPAHGPLVLVAPKAPHAMSRVLILPPPAPGAPSPIMAIAPRASYGAGYGNGYGQSSTTESGTVSQSENGKSSGYRYSYSSNGDAYAIVRGEGHMSFNGNIHTSDLEKVRKQAHGDFLWFEHGGKAYFIDDPATLSQIEAMYKPMEELGRQQEVLGKKQEELGKQQETLGKQQEAASVPTPDMSREIAEIDAAMAKLKANQGKNMTQDQFGEMQEKLAELQGQLGELQGRIGEQQGKFGEQMSVLGERMGELGEQMGRLGEQQGKIAENADRKVKAMIDESLKNGKAHPVQ
jgi:beta-lactamase regulating signal transducer with metallopeptidase domain